MFVVAAGRRDFWHDEVYTVLMASLPPKEIWAASRDGVDLMPPLNSILTHYVHALLGVGPVVSRLPGMVGFLAAMTLVAAIVRRRAGFLVACSSALALISTTAWRYGVEARGYGLSLGLFAAALYGWSEAAAGRKAGRNWSLMAVALAAGVWTHYFLVLAFVPITVGEAVRQARLRKLETAPWLALAAGAAMTLPLADLALAASGQSSSFWAQASGASFAGVYRAVLAGLPYPSLVVGLLALLVVAAFVRGLASSGSSASLPGHEIAAGLVCLVLPAAVVALGHVVHAYDPRYATFTCVGLAVVVPLAVHNLSGAGGVGNALLAILLGAAAGRVGLDTLTAPPLWHDLYASRPVLRAALQEDAPVVISGGGDYLPLWYYASSEARARAVYLADPKTQGRETGRNTIDLGYLALARWFDVPVVPVDEFLQTRKKFRLYSTGSGWTDKAVVQRGGKLAATEHEAGGGTLFDVEIQ